MEGSKKEIGEKGLKRCRQRTQRMRKTQITQTSNSKRHKTGTLEY